MNRLAVLTAWLALAPLQVHAAAAPPPPPPPLTGPPFAAFTPEDRDMFVTTAMRLVGSKPDGTQLRWANDASGAWGTMTLTRTFRSRGSQCREARGDTTAAGRTDAFRLVACRGAKGEWRIRSAGPARAR